LRMKLLVWAGGALALLAHLAVVYLLLRDDAVPAAMIVAGIGSAILGGGIALARRTHLVLPMILCGFLGSFFGAYYLDELRELEAQLVRSNVVRDVALDALGAQPAGRVVYLRDATLSATYVGGSEHKRRRGKVDVYRAAPVVTPGWTRADPVPAWAVFRTNNSMIGGTSEADGLATWATPARAGFIVANDGQYREAIADAERRHGLRSAPGAPLLEWRDPDAKRRGYRDRFWKVLLVTQLVWLAAAAFLGPTAAAKRG